jgi:hypothetical protein
MVKPLQIYMNEHELEGLDAWASKRGWTKSHAVRVAIRALTQDRDEDPLFRSCGMIDGLPEDLSERIGHYLEESFVAEKAASNYRKRRRGTT